MLKEQVLSYLENQKGELLTGGELSRRLDVSRTAVWKAVGALREDGNIIESVPKRGYRLTRQSDGISTEAISKNLSTKAFGRSIELLKTVPSTNQYLKSADTDALPHGHVVIADEQTVGRGRQSKPFLSPAGQGLYLSVLLKPDVAPQEAPFLTLCAAVAVSDAIDAVFGIITRVKWVNDIFCGGKKLCGILTQAQSCAEQNTMDYVVVGIGVNTGKISGELRDIATSTLEASGIAGRRSELAAALLNNLESRYIDFTQNGGKERIRAEYDAKLLYPPPDQDYTKGAM
jgi:BirA family biotin operon repressor/biotin-[acetyl-CoA-carboxylase] ligase